MKNLLRQDTYIKLYAGKQNSFCKIEIVIEDPDEMWLIEDVIESIKRL
jgi:hypothetical protein